MNRGYIILLVLVTTLFSCSKTRKQIKFEEFKNEVSSAVYLSFPIKEKIELESSSFQIINYPSGYKYRGYSGVFLVYENDSASLINILNNLKNSSIAIYNADDKCVPVIPNNSIKKQNLCSIEYYPVPEISSILPETGLFISKNDSRYYVLESKPGKYMKNIDYSEHSEKITNAKKNLIYENGFSNGVILDTKTNRLVYWILIW